MGASCVGDVFLQINDHRLLHSQVLICEPACESHKGLRLLDLCLRHCDPIDLLLGQVVVFWAKAKTMVSLLALGTHCESQWSV